MTTHRPADKIPCVYITGTSYSGSTLLAFLLNSHPQMASISETVGPIVGTDFATYRCSCGALFVECSFYLELEKRMREAGEAGLDFSLRQWRTRFEVDRERWIDIALARPLRNVFLERVRDAVVPMVPGYRRAIREVALRNAELARAALERLGKNIWVDAQKDSIRIKFLEQSGLFDLWVIHLVRDVRGGSASLMKYNNWTDAGRAARTWRNQNLNAERARRYVSPERWLQVRYDEVCDDVQGTMDRVADFVGVERAPVPADFTTVEHHIIGNVMRLRGVGEVRRDDSWKERLSVADLETIARVAGATNRHFGHSWPE